MIDTVLDFLQFVSGGMLLIAMYVGPGGFLACKVQDYYDPHLIRGRLFSCLLMLVTLAWPLALPVVALAISKGQYSLRSAMIVLTLVSVSCGIWRATRPVNDYLLFSAQPGVTGYATGKWKFEGFVRAKSAYDAIIQSRPRFPDKALRADPHPVPLP